MTNIASAGFIVEINRLKIIMDPWLIGTGFIGGWSPLSCSRIADIPTSIDYLWISHEHPDHFSPKTLTSLFDHWQELPTLLFQETVDDRVINWFKGQGCNTQILQDNKRLTLNKLELRLQKYGLYDSILQIRNEFECFTNLNDAPIQGVSDLRKVREFAGNRHHVMTSQYGVANSECGVDNLQGWKRSVESKKSLFTLQVKTIQPNICIPSASSVHFCAEDNLYMNKYRVNPAIFANGDCKLGMDTYVLLPLPSKKVETNSPKEIQAVNNKFEKYYDDLLKKTKNLVLQKKQEIELTQLKDSLVKCSQKVFKHNNRFILSFFRPFGLLCDQVFYLTDKDIYVRCSIWRGSCDEINPCEKYISISTEVLSQTYDSPYGGDALIASGRYDLKKVSLKSLSDHLSIIHINTAGIYFNFSIIFAPRQMKSLLRAAWSYLVYFREQKL